MPQDAKSLREFADFHQNYVSHYIQLADTKAGVVVTISGALIGYLLSQPDFRNSFGLSSTGSMIATLTLISLVSSFSLAFWVLRPRGGTPKGPVFFASVAAFPNFAEYRDHLDELSARELAQSRIEHCYALAKVCTRKYRALKWAMLTGLAGVIFTGLSILVLDL